MLISVFNKLTSEATVKCAAPKYEKKTEVATLGLEEELPGSGKGVLTLQFSAKLNREVRIGSKASGYKH